MPLLFTSALYLMLVSFASTITVTIPCHYWFDIISWRRKLALALRFDSRFLVFETKLRKRESICFHRRMVRGIFFFVSLAVDSCTACLFRILPVWFRHVHVSLVPWRKSPCIGILICDQRSPLMFAQIRFHVEFKMFVNLFEMTHLRAINQIPFVAANEC